MVKDRRRVPAAALGRVKGMDMDMTRAIALVVCGLGLASCSMPSFDLLSSRPATTTLSIESDPPGAEASISVGGSCHTPCTLPVPLTGDFTVSYVLAGYAPQTLPIRFLRGPAASVDRRQDVFEGLTESDVSPAPRPRLDPNPAFVQLRPAAPSRPAPRRNAPAVPADGAAPTAIR